LQAEREAPLNAGGEVVADVDGRDGSLGCEVERILRGLVIAARISIRRQMPAANARDTRYASPRG